MPRTSTLLLPWNSGTVRCSVLLALKSAGLRSMTMEAPSMVVTTRLEKRRVPMMTPLKLKEQR